MDQSTKQIWKAWLPAVVWLGVITIESTNYFSAEHTSRYLYPTLHFLFGLGPARFEIWHHYIRKTGHFVGYFTLSFLLFRAWRATLPAMHSRKWSMRWGTIAFLMTSLVASLDEWHQTFIPSRTGMVRDVFLDSWAALTAQIVIYLWLQTEPDGVSRSSASVRQISTWRRISSRPNLHLCFRASPRTTPRKCCCVWRRYTAFRDSAKFAPEGGLPSLQSSMRSRGWRASESQMNPAYFLR